MVFIWLLPGVREPHIKNSPSEAGNETNEPQRRREASALGGFPDLKQLARNREKKKCLIELYWFLIATRRIILKNK